MRHINSDRFSDLRANRLMLNRPLETIHGLQCKQTLYRSPFLVLTFNLSTAGDFALRGSVRLHKRRFKSHCELHVMDFVMCNTLSICLKASWPGLGHFNVPLVVGERDWLRGDGCLPVSSEPLPLPGVIMTTQLVGDRIR